MEHQITSGPKTTSRANANNTVQAKLAVNRPGDAYEQEADNVAARVMQTNADTTKTSPLPISSVQGMQEAGIPDAAVSGLENYIGTLNGGGQPLSPGTKEFFESRFGYDFGDVRIHTDSRAVESSAAVQAHAFTTGNHIVFNEGRYAPGNSEGQRLLAHELTHVVQQGGGPATDAGGQTAAASGPVQTQTIQKEGSEEDESWMSSIGSVVGLANEATGGLFPTLGMAGKALSGAGGLGKGLESGDPAGLVSGLLGFGGGAVDIAKTLGETGDTLSEGVLGKLGGISGLLGVGESGTKAYSDFSKGNILDGVVDSVKGVGQGLSGLASFGGFSMLGDAGVTGLYSSIAEGGLGVLGTEGGVAGSMLTADAGAAVMGGAGAEGLAALGPAGAVIGSGIAGWEAGKALDKGVNWLGQTISGDDKGDYSISGGLASMMTATDQSVSSLFADPSKPAYTQTLGWQLAQLGDDLGL